MDAYLMRSILTVSRDPVDVYASLGAYKLSKKTSSLAAVLDKNHWVLYAGNTRFDFLDRQFSQSSCSLWVICAVLLSIDRLPSDRSLSAEQALLEWLSEAVLERTV